MDNIIVVGDRVLIKQSREKNKTKTGLYLPPGYSTKEEIQTGYIVKVGPGYPIPQSEEEDWKPRSEYSGVRYIPLQAQEGDLAVYLQKSAVEVIINEEKYFIVPQHAILLLQREND